MTKHERPPKSYYPLWVKLAIWGMPGRAWVSSLVWVGVIGAAVLVVVALISPGSQLALWLVGAAWFAAWALFYWMAMRWVDRHGVWG